MHPEERAAKGLSECWQRTATVVASAPGRVNFIGEHTDYNGGLVLPLALDRRTAVAAVRHDGRCVRIASEHAASPVEIPLDRPLTVAEPRWANYVRGVLAGVAASGREVPGFDGFIASDVPPGGGLSSSAALTVALATLVETLRGESWQPWEKAKLAQRAEHEFAAVPCGLMDQTISVLGREGHLLELDCRDLSHRHVPWPDGGHALVVIDSGVRHDLAAGEYARRRDECLAAAAALNVKTLRDATLPAVDTLGDGVLRRRARHVVTENARVLRCAEALSAGDWGKVGALMLASHASLRDDFAVSCAELDELVDFAVARGARGARMTGGGFGGSVVALLPASSADALVSAARQRGKAAFVTRPSAGASGRWLR